MNGVGKFGKYCIDAKYSKYLSTYFSTFTVLILKYMLIPVPVLVLKYFIVCTYGKVLNECYKWYLNNLIFRNPDIRQI